MKQFDYFDNHLELKDIEEEALIDAVNRHGGEIIFGDDPCGYLSLYGGSSDLMYNSGNFPSVVAFAENEYNAWGKYLVTRIVVEHPLPGHNTLRVYGFRYSNVINANEVQLDIFASGALAYLVAEIESYECELNIGRGRRSLYMVLDKDVADAIRSNDTELTMSLINQKRYVSRWCHAVELGLKSQAEAYKQALSDFLPPDAQPLYLDPSNGKIERMVIESIKKELFII